VQLLAVPLLIPPPSKLAEFPLITQLLAVQAATPPPLVAEFPLITQLLMIPSKNPLPCA
jgi:hypothetical protein